MQFTDSISDINSYHLLPFGATQSQGSHVQLSGDNSKLDKYTLQTMASLFFNAASLLTIWSTELTSDCQQPFAYQLTHYRQEENSMIITKQVIKTCRNIIPLSICNILRLLSFHAQLQKNNFWNTYSLLIELKHNLSSGPQFNINSQIDVPG